MRYKEIKKVDVFSLAIVTGIVLGILAFFASIMLLLGMEGILYIVPYVSKSVDIFGRSMVVITLPLIYFSLGFLTAYIVGLIYNIIARKYRGIRIELE